MATSESASFWEAVRSWADSAGLLLPAEHEDAVRPVVPQSVCDSCPICQGAATLDQVNPQVIADVAEVARSVILGLGSALAAAAENRSFVTGRGTDRTDEQDPEPPKPDDDEQDPDEVT
ncbi:MAG: hypothetical protein WCF36_01745 [Candidatus Nanopelagicales bacterium]